MELPRFKTVHVRCQRQDSLLIRWQLEPTAYKLEDADFEIFRSMSTAGPWDLIGTAETGMFHFYDLEIEGPHSFRNYYYIVRLADKTGRGFRDSGVENLSHDPDNLALELVRKKNVYLTVRGGIRGAVLVRKRWGAKCSRCWNDERQLPTDADCPICYGTGYAGGYCKPVPVPAGIIGPDSKEYAETVGTIEISQSAFEISNQPLLQPDDVFVDVTLNCRYFVKKVTGFTRRGYIVSQILTCTRLDDNAAVYQIDIPESFASMRGQSFDLVQEAQNA